MVSGSTATPRPGKPGSDAAARMANITWKQLVPVGGPFRRERLNHLLEGEIGVRQGGESRSAHPIQQIGKTGIRRQIDAQRQGIEEAADQRLELDPPPVIHRRAHHDILLPGVTVEQRQERGEQPHEQRRAAPPGEVAQPVGQHGRQAKRLRCAAPAAGRRAGAISRQR